ncbi:LamB/YcsF family protein [Amycolatopsis sp. FDAARGOS 1241]|nr:LamB/YcsF family protein [Amycolatopsis sp. FDAARGOS 1241]
MSGAEPGPRVDLNRDIGEGFGRRRMPFDAELMKLVTTVNVAAGCHAGDPSLIRSTIRTAVEEALDIADGWK